MKRFLAAAVFVTVAVLGANVHAQQETGNQSTGPYVGGHLGLNILSDSEINGGTLATDEDTLIGFGGVLGYDFGNFRVDGEIALRFNTIDRLGGQSLDPQSLGSGNNSTTIASSYMVNGYFDLPTGGPWKPYIGGGIGFATVVIDWVAPGFFPFSSVTVADDNDSGLAYQFSGGIGYEINPRTTVTLSYRYFTTEELQMTFASGSPFGSGPFTMKYQSNEINLGVRFLFH
jgi:opacity protein-like surface antigen